MTYKRLLTIQDISCVGQCSITVALPIISACGIECSVLPSSVLSTHTGGFTGYTFRDLSEDMPDIMKHWQKENLYFDAIYTGYLGSIKQIEYTKDIFEQSGKAVCIKIVDPAMADNGSLYYGFNNEFAKNMATLCQKADYILPNITEACFMTDTEYKTKYNKDYIELLINKLNGIGCKNIILTGVSYSEKTTGVVISENGSYLYYEHEKHPKSSHGTGDVFASAFTGSFIRGKSLYESAKIAADFTYECIKFTQTLENHTYGAAFEPVLPKLIYNFR